MGGQQGVLDHSKRKRLRAALGLCPLGEHRVWGDAVAFRTRPPGSPPPSLLPASQSHCLGPDSPSEKAVCFVFSICSYMKNASG